MVVLFVVSVVVWDVVVGSLVYARRARKEADAAITAALQRDIRSFKYPFVREDEEP
jgi:uncharacterized membrane protein